MLLMAALQFWFQCGRSGNRQHLGAPFLGTPLATFLWLLRKWLGWTTAFAYPLKAALAPTLLNEDLRPEAAASPDGVTVFDTRQNLWGTHHAHTSAVWFTRAGLAGRRICRAQR